MEELCIYNSADGFEISDEDYFATLEPQTLFIVASPNAIITTGLYIVAYFTKFFN